MAGEPTKELVGETLILAGWAARRRDHGGLIFVDLRDRTGITQLVINPELAPEAAELAHQIRNEFVLRAEGTLVARSAETVNPNMPTGEVELQVETARDRQPLDAAAVPARRGERRRDAAAPLSLARPAPREAAAEHHPARADGRDHPPRDGGRRLPRHPDADPLQADARGRARLRRPGRLQKGRFYALPQSPQILKQLTMVAGFDRYYQIAICFRDEDLRADRVQEITQLDVEMSFPDQEFLYATMERMYARIWRECLGIEIETPFPRMTFEEADRRFGTDKPDTRFALEIEDATEVTRELRVRRLQERRGRALPARAAGVLAAATSRSSRSSRRSGGRRGSPTSSSTRRARCARRSRSSSPRRSSRSSAAIPARPCSSPPTAGRRPHACSARCAATSARSSA